MHLSLKSCNHSKDFLRYVLKTPLDTARYYAQSQSVIVVRCNSVTCDDGKQSVPFEHSNSVDQTRRSFEKFESVSDKVPRRFFM